MTKNLKELARDIKLFSVNLASSAESLRNEALSAVKAALWADREVIYNENRIDLEAGSQSGLPDPILKRLRFDEAKLQSVLDGIDELIALPDPLGRLLLRREMDTDLTLERITCPIGVIGVIFESRPDALVQIATLCLKSGNCALMKGGSEAMHTNRILYRIIFEAACSCGIDPHFLTLLESRSQIDELLDCEGSIDLLIPRGSNEFVSYIMDHTKIPVMGHASGVCHVYVGPSANVSQMVPVVLDSKLQYVVVCNAAETLLVHESIAPVFLPALLEGLGDQELEIRGDVKAAQIIPCTPAADEDFGSEFADRILAVKIVSSTKEAIDHINRYGSAHTDAILTEDPAEAATFFSLVDSASVMHNCSTRFADGFRYGFGAEVGISTGKLHARGPVGLEGLTTYKYLVHGKGQIVAPYSSGKKKFHFRDL
ncbi:MAG TPA: glutamate-5-semialdehyde dehydrogenase [Clostridiales bacterium]|nr:glutamate-5-semialdehyde dehydrogenase [Clostridiales bacterium]